MHVARGTREICCVLIYTSSVSWRHMSRGERGARDNEMCARGSGRGSRRRRRLTLKSWYNACTPGIIVTVPHESIAPHIAKPHAHVRQPRPRGVITGTLAPWLLLLLRRDRDHARHDDADIVTPARGHVSPRRATFIADARLSLQRRLYVPPPRVQPHAARVCASKAKRSS